MRDFPQLPLNIRELHVWGFLIGAEQEALQRGTRFFFHYIYIYILSQEHFHK